MPSQSLTAYGERLGDVVVNIDTSQDYYIVVVGVIPFDKQTADIAPYSLIFGDQGKLISSVGN